MNKVLLVGRLTAKPELRYTNSNTAFVRFSVAVNRPFANKDGNREADFINVVAWRKQAETISRYFDKGSLISIEGRIQTGSYDDKDGNRRYTMDVALDNFEFVEGRNRNQADASMNNDYSTNDNSYSNSYSSNYNSNAASAPSPYDYQDNSSSSNVDVVSDPFTEYGDSVSIDDSFLD